jgi:leader peptidase (prepilin peptidase) / N-methyltransferase
VTPGHDVRTRFPSAWPPIGRWEQVPVALVATAALGIVAGWALTVFVHRWKELRPLTPRDVAAEVGGGDGPTVTVRAAFREARCPHCHHRYRAADVVPVIGWSRGCPGCGARLPWTVPLIQVGVPLAMIVTIWSIDRPWIAVPYLWLVVVLAAVAVIDLRIWLIPWWMPWLGAAVGMAMITTASIALGEPAAILWAALGGVGAFLFLGTFWFVAPGKLGFGDVRLALLLGVFLGWLHPLFPIYGLLFGSLIGVAMGLASVVSRRGVRFPFGPALALGALVAVWFHAPLLARLGVA